MKYSDPVAQARIDELEHDLAYWQDLWKFAANGALSLIGEVEELTGKPYRSSPEQIKRAEEFDKKWFGEEEDD
jgi:hypothetical protein